MDYLLGPRRAIALRLALSDTALRDRKRDCTSGQSGHAEALELDMDEALQNQGQQGAARNRNRAGALKITFLPDGHDELEAASVFPLYLGVLQRLLSLARQFRCKLGPDNNAAWPPSVVTFAQDARCTAVSKPLQTSIEVSFQAFAISVWKTQDKNDLSPS